jgi:hypothetical protein
MTERVKLTAEQIRELPTTGHAYKMIASYMAEWAADKERGTVPPENEYFGIEASDRTYCRAKNLLANIGVLARRPYQVA